MMFDSRIRLVLGGWIAAAIAGCSGPSVKTYPVRGAVELKGGDVAVLTGSHVELLHESDPAIRPSGVISPDGTFDLETLHQGKTIRGAPAGQYKARLVLADESDEGVPQRKGNPVHRRFFDFQTSGLSLAVPGDAAPIVLSQK